MMRSLWTAASGMVAQQTNLDTISNNLSNINTTGYKTEAVNFKSLIYQTLQQKSYDSKGEPKPVIKSLLTFYQERRLFACCSISSDAVIAFEFIS